MRRPVSRRDALKQLGVAGGGLLCAGAIRGPASAPIVVAGQPVEIGVWSVSASTVRITVRPLAEGVPAPVPFTG
ncbi:MAG: twin-arginine translocation signal domain-containing protein, partial [Longimicrobiales bacterium]